METLAMVEKVTSESARRKERKKKKKKEISFREERFGLWCPLFGVGPCKDLCFGFEPSSDQRLCSLNRSF